MEEMKKSQPLNNVVWRDREELTANDYNPNKVAKPEMALLKISILEDGWTQPIVINPDMTIVDGFHRWTISADKEIAAMTEGKIPTVMLNPTSREQQQMATIRHNRARGTHKVLDMSSIVTDLVKSGISGEEIMHRLGMEKEEVTRLLFRAGIPKSEVFKKGEFSKAWTPE